MEIPLRGLLVTHPPSSRDPMSPQLHLSSAWWPALASGVFTTVAQAKTGGGTQALPSLPERPVGAAGRERRPESHLGQHGDRPAESAWTRPSPPPAADLRQKRPAEPASDQQKGPHAPQKTTQSSALGPPGTGMGWFVRQRGGRG